MSASWVSICYLIFGIASVSGNAVGGWVSDKIGTSKAIILIVSAFAIVLFSILIQLLPFHCFSVYGFMGCIELGTDTAITKLLNSGGSSIIGYSAKPKYSCSTNWYFYRISSWWRNVCMDRVCNAPR